MTETEVKETIKLLPTFIKMCENDLEEADHNIKKSLTYEEYQKVEKLLSKLHYLDQYVDGNIFE